MTDTTWTHTQQNTNAYTQPSTTPLNGQAIHAACMFSSRNIYRQEGIIK